MVADLRTRILDASLEASTIHGLKRMSVTDVAERAGISRVTLYKHFASKDELIAASVLREAGVIVEAVLRAATPHEDPRDALEAGIAACLVALRDHPLLDRIVRTEPETLTPLLVSDGGPVIGLVRGSVDALIADKFPGLGPVTARRLSDVVARLLISFALITPDDPPEVVAASIADLLIDGARRLLPHGKGQQ